MVVNVNSLIWQFEKFSIFLFHHRISNIDLNFICIFSRVQILILIDAELFLIHCWDLGLCLFFLSVWQWCVFLWKNIFHNIVLHRVHLIGDSLLENSSNLLLRLIPIPLQHFATTLRIFSFGLKRAFFLWQSDLPCTTSILPLLIQHRLKNWSI